MVLTVNFVVEMPEDQQAESAVEQGWSQTSKCFEAGYSAVIHAYVVECFC